MTESATLRISSIKTLDVAESLDPMLDRGDEIGIAVYTEEIYDRMLWDRQQTLLNCLDGASHHFKIFDPDIFELAAASAYDMIPKRERRTPLKEEHTQSTVESLLRFYHGSDDPELINAASFIDPFEKNSPLFFEWFMSNLRIDEKGLEDENWNSDFIIGTLLVLLPFKARIENRQLKKLWKKKN